MFSVGGLRGARNLSACVYASPNRLAYHLIRIIYLLVAANRGIHYGLSTEVSKSRELRMQDTGFNSIGALTRSHEVGSWLATKVDAKRQLGHVASRVRSSCPVGELVIVSIVSIFLLRGSG